MSTSRTKAIIVCVNCLSRNYTFNKSTMNNSERLEIKKFCPTCNMHVLHKETR
ncbi:50S ribosomal protein L33 [Spiroplasma corruscae]|uniref:50S ribosomal protein L33 n=1 Tax=Spiroplasma corruscae TaxID=216934 RepID=UPI000B8BF183|nr:50S ribosomal protein L33 [Spiroplasma corruscae]